MRHLVLLIICTGFMVWAYYFIVSPAIGRDRIVRDTVISIDGLREFVGSLSSTIAQ